MEEYDIKSSKVGIAIIINIRKSGGNDSDLRSGSLEDVKNLTEAFNKMGMTVFKLKKDKTTADGIMEFLEKRKHIFLIENIGR